MAWVSALSRSLVQQLLPKGGRYSGAVLILNPFHHENVSMELNRGQVVCPGVEFYIPIAICVG
jgi:hypothetical protein